MPKCTITAMSPLVKNALRNGELYVTPAGRVAKVIPRDSYRPLSVLRRVYVPHEDPDDGLNLIDMYAHTVDNIRQCKETLRLIFDRCLSKTKRLISIIDRNPNQDDISYSILANDSTNLTQLDVELEKPLASSQRFSVIPLGTRSEVTKKWLGFFTDCRSGGEYKLPAIDMRYDLIPKECRGDFIESTVNQLIVDMRVDTAKKIFGLEVYTDKELVQEYQRVLGLLKRYSEIAVQEKTAPDISSFEMIFVNSYKKYHLDELLENYNKLLKAMRERKLLNS